MARPPPNRPLTQEDVPGAPSWVERLLERLNLFQTPVASALAGGLTLAENFAGEVKTISVTPPDDWEALTPLNNFVRATGGTYDTDRPSPAWRKDHSGQVYLRGAVDRSSAPSADTPIVRVPAGSASTHVFDFQVWASATSSVLRAFGDGNVSYVSGGVDPIVLNQVTWLARDRTPPRWTTPVDVRLGTAQKPFPGRPGYVLALRARVAGAPTSPALVTAVDWEPTVLEGDKKSLGVRIHRLWGLVPSTAHNVTLLVLPE